MVEVRLTVEFRDWLAGLRDRTAQRRIAARIARAEGGNLGDAKFFEGIGEMRISHGPGYRLYFRQRVETTAGGEQRIEVVLLLCGGDKSSQARDVKRAIAMAKEV